MILAERWLLLLAHVRRSATKPPGGTHATSVGAKNPPAGTQVSCVLGCSPLHFQGSATRGRHDDAQRAAFLLLLLAPSVAFYSGAGDLIKLQSRSFFLAHGHVSHCKGA